MNSTLKRPSGAADPGAITWISKDTGSAADEVHCGAESLPLAA